MKLTKIILSTGIASFLTLAPAQSGGEADARLSAFLEEVFQRGVNESPTLQAELSIKTADYGKWDDYSDEFAVKQNADNERDIARLKTEISYDALSESARVSYKVFEHEALQRRDNWNWRFHGYVASQIFAIASDLPSFLVNVHDVATVKDAEAYISRLNGLERAYGQLATLVRTRAQRGIVSPRLVYPYVIGDMRKIITGAPFDRSGRDAALYADFKAKVAKLTIGEPVRANLIGEAEKALLGPAKRGVESYIAELERIAPLAPQNDGVWRLPGGEAYYANRIRYSTTVDMTADEVHRLGLSEVTRIHGEMAAIQREVGFNGTFAAFFEHVRTSTDNYYPNTDAGRAQYLADARSLIDRVYAHADRYFNLRPKAPVEVRRVEEWREDTSPIAFYKEPAPDGSRPGVYYVNLKNMASVQKHTMNSLAYHEAVPGHHFQLGIAQELRDLPSFRRYSHNGAFTEGWALYAELLAYEMGLYADQPPLRNFGRLQYELMRATRLVVDTGIHSKRWSRQQAIEYMRENTPMSLGDVTKEVDRYIVMPGQALSYKIGMMKMLEQREKARRELGARFDIRDFHDIMLKNAAVPLPVLERLIAGYIGSKKAMATGNR